MPGCVVAIEGDTVGLTRRRCRHVINMTPRPIPIMSVCMATLARAGIENDNWAGMNDREFPLLFLVHRLPQFVDPGVSVEDLEVVGYPHFAASILPDTR